MLTDQPPKPIRLLIGPEIFYARNPLRLNMSHILAFQRHITPSQMFRFDYIAFNHSVTLGGNQELMVNRLRDAGIALDPIYFKPPKLTADPKENRRLLHEMTEAADGIFPTEVLNVYRITPKTRPFPGAATDFVGALVGQTEISTSWDWSNFCAAFKSKK